MTNQTCKCIHCRHSRVERLVAGVCGGWDVNNTPSELVKGPHRCDVIEMAGVWVSTIVRESSAMFAYERLYFETMAFPLADDGRPILWQSSASTQREADRHHDLAVRWFSRRGAKCRNFATSMALADLLANVPPGHRTEPWTWDDEERDIRSRLCLCCGKAGHHQEELEARIAGEGLTEGVCIGEDGRLHDGHHRVVAARTLGIERVPLETRAEADKRGRRDHGTYIWELRHFGDVHAGAEWEYVQAFRQAARDFVGWERRS